MSNLHDHTHTHKHDHNTVIDANHDYAEANRAYFDKEAAKSNEDHPQVVEITANLLGPAILGVYPFDKDKTTVLDYACARGSTSKQLLPHVKSLVGVDISQGMVDAFNQYASKQGIAPDEMKGVRAELKGEDGELDGQKFDVVLCSMAYHHFSDINKVTVVLAHFLKPGGMLIVIDFRAGPKPTDDKQESLMEQVRHIVPHDGIAETAIRVAFESAGLDKLEVKDIGPANVMGNDVIFFVATGVKMQEKI